MQGQQESKVRKMRIMVVDDSKVMRHIVKRALRNAVPGSHVVEEFENGKQALKAIRANAPQIVLCDWNMPEMTGIELLIQLRAEGCTLPFGFVTSEATPHMRSRAEEAGATFLLAKPFTADDMQAALEPVLKD